MKEASNQSGHLKKISVYGSTGSIGTQCLSILRAFPEKYQVSALSAGKNIEILKPQIREFKPQFVNVAREEDRRVLKAEFPEIQISSGPQELLAMTQEPCDVAVMGISGFAALAPTLEVVKTAKVLALANKESLVVAGKLLMAGASQSGCHLLPIDSEHNGLFQLLSGFKKEEIETLVLTASGGPLFKLPHLPLSQVTPEIAIKHPNWAMGPKISVDSATLMNKGLEWIEACMLFGVPSHQVEIWIHPQSILHAAISLKDGTYMAQMGRPDMRAPIGYALSYPERLERVIPRLGFGHLRQLEFFAPDTERFACLRLAGQALQASSAHLVALNASNEVAVEAFLNRALTFDRIPEVIEKVLEKCSVSSPVSLEQVLELDLISRREAQFIIG